jgi:hypothetical protein
MLNFVQSARDCFCDAQSAPIEVATRWPTLRDESLLATLDALLALQHQLDQVIVVMSLAATKTAEPK